MAGGCASCRSAARPRGCGAPPRAGSGGRRSGGPRAGWPRRGRRPRAAAYPCATMSRAMAVLVDELREYPHVRFAVKLWCHMVSDESFDELHAFAAALGIPRERFQRDHYDLPPHVRERAVALGAVEVAIG